MSRPDRADLVGAVAETTGTWALGQLRDRMRADPEGRRILEERPRVNVSVLGGRWLILVFSSACVYYLRIHIIHCIWEQLDVYMCCDLSS